MATQRQLDTRPAHVTAAEQVEIRIEARRRRLLGVAGMVLVAYGLAGLVLFAAVAYSIGGSIDEAGQLTVSIEGQRGDVLDALEQAVVTIDDASAGISGMDASLAQANEATGRAAFLSLGMAASMFELRDAMSATIFGMQPLIGLAAGFEQTGQQLELLAADVAAIGDALEANRGDARNVAASLDRLHEAVARLSEGVRDGPSLEVSSDALAGMRLGIYAVIAWMLVLALGCVVAGVACLVAARR